MSKKNLGNYFWRNGKKIEVEREEEYFTALVRDGAELERLKSLQGVSDVKLVQNKIFKVHISKDQRDAAMERFRSKDIGGVCHHAYKLKDIANTRYYITEQIIVKFREDVSEKHIETILSETGVRNLKEYPGSKNTFLVQVTRNAGVNPLKVANSLAEYKEVEYAEPNLVNRFQLCYTPPDTLFERQWHLRSRNGVDVVENADVSATEAWDIERGKRSVVIAILDDGFDLSHPDFSGTGKVVHPKDYVDGDAHPFPEAAEGDYHGTPCAGVALAEENGEGVVGIAPGCAFMPVRFPLSADDDFLWEIFDYVGKRANVISCSWGPIPAYAPIGTLLSQKFQELASSGGPNRKGCVIVFAAGNYNAPLNDPNNTSFTYRLPRSGLVEYRGPILNGLAAHPDVVAVSAMTSMNRKAAYSNWGKEISVCAPSNNFHPLDPQISVQGLSIWTTDNEQYGLDFSSGSRFTGIFGGTSSATPLVAGIAALVMSTNDLLTANEVRQILRETADKIVDNQPDPVLDNQKGSYDSNGLSEWFGYGRVNAAKAVRRARDLRETATGISDIDIGVTKEGNFTKSEEVRHFKVTVGDKLGVTLQGPEGQDFDLYVKRGSPPTMEDYDAKGYTGSANEKVVIQPAEAGDYYIMVRSFRGSGDFTIKVDLK